MAEYNQYVNLQERALQYYNQNTDQKDEKDEADDDVQLNAVKFKFANNFGVKVASQIGNPNKPTLTQLPDEAKELANLVKISTTFHKKG